MSGVLGAVEAADALLQAWVVLMPELTTSIATLGQMVRGQAVTPAQVAEMEAAAVQIGQTAAAKAAALEASAPGGGVQPG
ncbi:MAG: hypothetical protein KGH75_00940 [Rhodospirillales bacterium]|nr:hypothetical protein [Rhodospirillales bacterium]